MPSKGSTLKTGDRLRLVTPKFHRQFMKDTGIEIEYALFSEIINECNSLTSLKVIDNISGYKLPLHLGYLAVTKYKDKRRKVDFKTTKDLGKVTHFANFHTYGYSSRILWFSSQITRCKFHQIYKFVPERKVNRTLGKRLFAGKQYNEFNYSHFKSKKIRLDIDKRFNN